MLILGGGALTSNGGARLLGRRPSNGVVLSHGIESA